MPKWIIIVVILFVQETVTLNALLVKVFQGQYSLLLITILFLFATVIDIFVGSWVGGYVKQRWNKGKVRAFAKKWTQRFYAYVGTRGIRVYLLLLGYFSFPYVNAFITSWLDIPFWDSFWYLFVGNIIFYLSVSLLVLGVTSIIPSPFYALVTVITLTILFIVCIRVLKSRKI